MGFRTWVIERGSATSNATRNRPDWPFRGQRMKWSPSTKRQGNNKTPGRAQPSATQITS
jgi:hypothetical protein